MLPVMRKPTAAGSRRYENRAKHARFFVQAENRRKDRCFLLIGAKRQTILRVFRLPPGPAVCGRFSSLAHSRASETKGNTMSRRKNSPKEPFRRTQVVSPVPSERRYGKAKLTKRPFDIYVTDLENGEEFLAITVHAFSKRNAVQSGKKKLQFSSLLRKITYAAYSAVEVEE
jgi:hypothetical protein